MLSLLKKIFSGGKKIFIVLLVYFVVVSIFMYFFKKDKIKITVDPVQKNRREIYKIINDKKLNSTKEGQLSVASYRLMVCGLVGEACSNNPQDGDKNYSKSLFGFMTNLIVLPYANPPASGVYWAYSGLQKSGFIPKTYAAGIGFSSLSAFMPIWDAFRKVAYLILVLIIVTIGFMIMFRMKLNPQTVISVENALPKIVISLILITFSYAIVGFLIDLMYLVTLVGIEIIGVNGNIPNISEMQNTVITSHIFEIFDFGKIFRTYFLGIYAIIRLFPFIIQVVISSVIGFLSIILTLRLAVPLNDWVKDLLGQLTADANVVVAGLTINVSAVISIIIAITASIILGPFFTGLIMAVIACAGLLFLLFRIFFLLLSSLIQIILYLIFAPIFLMFEAVPGRSAFSGWFKNIIGNLIIFPTVVILFTVTYLIYQININNTPIFTPPLLAGINSNALAPLINAVFLMMIPDLAKALKQAVIGKQGMNLPVSPGALFGGGAAVASSLGGLQQIYYWRLGWQALFGHGKKGTENYDPGLIGNIIGGVSEAKKAAGSQS